ncbi:protein SIEVE ELEMENT OCCLUSION A-like [Telopea speciosissima]|uniref:protein SIEVE ELEMENT OCCLUSION A-like n=1 Tax=Telopea speciosissima TaxID=54955 RepID=UPI001CC490AB|nr:protein SIEVE ELEMENT OCCLUSION A-like [Telopea speciosissima]
MASTSSISKMQQSQQQQFSTSDDDDDDDDDNEMMKQILATHSDHNYHKVDVRPHLQLIDEIFRHSTTHFQRTNIHDPEVSSHMESLDKQSQKVDFLGMLEALACTIHKVSCEISCRCTGGGDVHSTTMALLSNTLSRFSWDEKVIVALAAFAVIYGEFWLVEELYGTHPLANAIALLKQLPHIFEQPRETRSLMRLKFKALWTLIKAMLDVTNGIVQINELPRQHFANDQLPMSVADTIIRSAVYWTIRSVVACASHITGFIDHYNYRSLSFTTEAYTKLVRLFETIHYDNMEILNALIYGHNVNVGVEALRRMSVLLLISDLDISQEEILILEQMYMESRHQPLKPESTYEVVWLPVVDMTLPWTEARERDFDRLQVNMRWYSVRHPFLINPAVIKYIKEMWHFNKKPIFVVLDPQGRVVNHNAYHMLWIWGSHAFPFTSMREEALWKEESWRLEFLVNGIDLQILNWIVEERFICLYGAEDIDWIRKFTTTARAVAQAARIPLEMVYVGKSNPKDRVRRNNDIITAEKLSHCWPDLTFTWFFWIRLESMWYSKMQHGNTIENDPIMKEIITMLTFDGSEQGWALISKGSANMAKAKGDMILNCFKNYDVWKENVDLKGFIQALNDHLKQLHTDPHHCSRLNLPVSLGMIPMKVVCIECGRNMEKSVTYSCCID